LSTPPGVDAAAGEVDTKYEATPSSIRFDRGRDMTVDTEVAGFDRGSSWRSYPGDEGLSPVLSAALDLFVERGFHATSIRMIAERAGMSVPGVYYHCDGKGDLLASLIRRAHGELRARTQAALDTADPDPVSRFKAFVENTVLFMTYRWRLSLIPKEIDALEDSLVTPHKQLRAEFQDMLQEVIDTGVAAGSFHLANPRGVTRAVLVLCRGVAEWYSPKGAQSPEDIAAEYVGYSLALIGIR
jgi:AcrR family transcriptional regulator